MARIGGPKTRNGGRWTEARFNSFIKSNLRSASRKWQPINDCLKKARVSRGVYLCNGCKEEVPNSKKIDGRRTKNVFVDHIKPIVDPLVGFVSWDILIERMFCEEENLQVLCYECHKVKTDEEKAQHKERRASEKE